MEHRCMNAVIYTPLCFSSFILNPIFLSKKRHEVSAAKERERDWDRDGIGAEKRRQKTKQKIEWMDQDCRGWICIMLHIFPTNLFFFLLLPSKKVIGYKGHERGDVRGEEKKNAAFVHWHFAFIKKISSLTQLSEFISRRRKKNISLQQPITLVARDQDTLLNRLLNNAYMLTINCFFRARTLASTFHCNWIIPRVLPGAGAAFFPTREKSEIPQADAALASRTNDRLRIFGNCQKTAQLNKSYAHAHLSLSPVELLSSPAALALSIPFDCLSLAFAPPLFQYTVVVYLSLFSCPSRSRLYTHRRTQNASDLLSLQSTLFQSISRSFVFRLFLSMARFFLSICFLRAILFRPSPLAALYSFSTRKESMDYAFFALIFCRAFFGRGERKSNKVRMEI